MRMIEAKITPEVLTWARESQGHSIDEVVDKLKKKITSETVKAWESGDKYPSYAQLKKLAGIYKRPIAIFFFPSPPEEPSIQKKFRSLPESYVKNLSPKIRYTIRKAEARQIDLDDLHGGIAPFDIQDFRNKIKDIPRESPKELAKQVRKIIGVSLKEQFDFSKDDVALKCWRSKLENVGIWIFKDAFDDDYCGFCLHDEHFPVIYLNNSMPKSRQIFSLFHELGHLLKGGNGIDFRDNIGGEYEKEEVFCNAFAGSFLVPDEDFSILKEPSDEKIEEWAKKYHVSREVILRKCLDKGLIDNEFYNKKVKKWQAEWDNRGSKTGVGGNYHYTQKAYLGDKYLKLSFKQYYQQRIDEYQLADYLRVKIKAIPNLEAILD